MSNEINSGLIYAEAKAYAFANPGVTPAQIRQLFPSVTPAQSRKLAAQARHAATRVERELAYLERRRELAKRSAEKKAAALEYAKANPNVSLNEIARQFNCCVKHVTVWRASESSRRFRQAARERAGMEKAERERVVREISQSPAVRQGSRRQKWYAVVDGQAVDPRSVRDANKISRFMLV